MSGLSGRRTGLLALAAVSLGACELEFTDPSRPSLRYWIRGIVADSVETRLSLRAGLVADVAIDVDGDSEAATLRVNGQPVAPTVEENSLQYDYSRDFPEPGAITTVVEPPTVLDADLPIYELHFIRRIGPRVVYFDPSGSIELPLAVPAGMPAVDFLDIQVREATDDDGRPILTLSSRDALVPDTIHFSALHLAAMEGQAFEVIARSLNVDEQTNTRIGHLEGPGANVIVQSTVHWRLVARSGG